MNTEHRKSILVLEDDVQWQTVVSQALKKTGQPLSIRCVPTAEQAIQLMDEGEKYEFIVADQNLGGASTGLDFYRYCQDTRVSASFVMFSSLDKSSFVDLIGSDIDQPRFVSKLTELKGLQSMFANDMSLIDGRTLSLPLSDAEIGNLRKAENLMLALIVIGAASAGLLQVDLSSAVLPEASIRIETLKPAESFKVGRQIVAAPLLKKSQTSLVSADLKAQVARIVKRADTMRKTEY